MVLVSDSSVRQGSTQSGLSHRSEPRCVGDVRVAVEVLAKSARFVLFSLLPNSCRLAPPSRFSSPQATKDRSWHLSTSCRGHSPCLQLQNQLGENRSPRRPSGGVAISRRSSLAIVFALKRARRRDKFSSSASSIH